MRIASLTAKPLIAGAVVLSLAACGVGGPSNPDRVTLNADTLAVHFFNGSVCRADIKAAPTGSFANCGEVMDYAVVIEKPSLAAGTVLDQFFAPYATITLTRPSDNRAWVWRTPGDDAARMEGAPQVRPR